MEFDSWVKAALGFDTDAASSKPEVKPPDKTKTVADTTKAVTDASIEKLAKLSSADQVKLVKALFANGKPTGDARKAQIKLYKAMHLDPAFKTREEKRGTAIAAEIGADKDVKAARNDWAKQTAAQKIAVLKKIVAAQSKQYGFTPTEIVTYDEPPFKDAGGRTLVTNGHFEAKDGRLHININAGSAISDFEEVVNTALHENGHRYQARLVKDLRAGKIKPGDPDYAQAAMFDVNDDDNAYIQPSEDFDAYVGQPEENHSRIMGADIASKINIALQKKGH